MVHDIAVIGAGACAVSLLSSLKDELGAASTPRTSIALWGRSETFGVGEAFGAAQREHLVNTQAALLGLTESDPAGFVRWLANRGSEGHRYPERKAMARFLQDSYAGLRRASALDVVEFRDEAIDIGINRDGTLQVFGRAASCALARCVVLCVGAVPSRNLSYLSADSGYRGSGGEIGPVRGATVLIAGTGPSGLDALRSAMAGGAREVHLFSRNGFLPTCQSLAPHYQPKHFTWPLLREQCRGGSIGLARVLALFQRELREMGARCEFEPAAMALKQKGTSAFLSYLLSRAQAHDLPLQDLLMSTRLYMHQLWRALSLGDRLLFHRVWRALWSAWRHPVPAGTYEQLRDAVGAGFVRIHRVVRPPVCRDGQFWIDTAESGVVQGSVLVDATGWSAYTDSTALLRALCRRRLIEMHPCGGVNVDPESMQCIVGSRPVRGLFAIGPIAHGVLFSTNAHWFNVRCAAQWARQWVAEAREACSPASRASGL